jgi:hypothetical protein
MHIDLPSPLLEAVKDQRAILFLGAGASRDSAHPTGSKIPNGNDLRDLICDKFLDGKYTDRTLALATEFCYKRDRPYDRPKFPCRNL